MIRFSGGSRQLGWCFLLASLFLWFGFPVLVFFFPPPEKSDQVEQDRRAEQALLLKLSLAGGMFVAGALPAALLGYVGWRFLDGGVSLQVDEDGFLFPVVPGVKWGRRLRWEDIARVEEWTADSFPKASRGGFRLLKWFAGNGPCLGVDLQRHIRDVKFGGRVITAMYRFNDALASGLVPGERGQRLVLEILAVDEAPFDVVVAGINTLIENPALREEYLTPGEETRMARTEDGQIAFVRVAKPLD